MQPLIQACLAAPINLRLLSNMSDISWTPAPVSIQTFPGNEHDPHALFWSVAELTYPDKRATSLSAPHPSVHHGTTLPPDGHLACFDYLYYTAASTVRCYSPFLETQSSILTRSFDSHSNGTRTIVRHGASWPNISAGLSASRT